MPEFTSDSQQDALSSLQQFAARRVDKDPVFFQRGTCGRGQAAGPGAASVAPDTVAVPACEGRGEGLESGLKSDAPAVSLSPGGLLIQGVGALKIRQRCPRILPSDACMKRDANSAFNVFQT